MARLPIPGSDSQKWGDILNEFLSVEHNNDGTLKAGGSLANKFTKPAGGIGDADINSISIGKVSGLQTKLDDTQTVIDEVVASVQDVNTAIDTKQDNITLTTTGTTGAATFVGNTLNIPQYPAGGAGSGVTVASVNDVTSNASQAVGNLSNDLGGTALADIKFVTIGNSYHVPDGALHRTNRHYTQIIRDRFGMTSLTTKAVGGSTAGQIAASIYQTGAPTEISLRDQSFVGASISGNNVQFGNTATNRKTVREATRSILALLTADTKIAANSDAFVYSANFSRYTMAGAIGSHVVACFDIGEFFEIKFTGSQGIDLVFLAIASNSGIYRVSEGATILYELDAQGVDPADQTMIIQKVRGLGAGEHTIRVTNVAGSGMVLNGALIPSSVPRSGYVVLEPNPDAARINNFFPGVNYDAIRPILHDEIRAAMPEYPTFMLVDPNLSGWNPAVMTGEGLHPNEWGHQYLFNETSRFISRTAYNPGLGHMLTYGQTYPAAYVAPTPPAVPAGGISGTSFAG